MSLIKPSNTHLLLISIQSQNHLKLAELIYSVLENPNDLSDEQFIYWKTFGCQLAEIGSSLAKLGTEYVNYLNDSQSFQSDKSQIAH